MEERIQAFKLVGAGLATIGLVGAGAGAGVIFGSLLLAYSRNPSKGDALSALCHARFCANGS
jgi:F0F1-type ATP synthase membrane subunit c/vacuolar-type H+-ATPase subunit K